MAGPRWVLQGLRLWPSRRLTGRWAFWRTYRGEGLFETVGCEDGRPFLWQQHGGRLLASARELWQQEPTWPSPADLTRLLGREGLAQGPAVVRVVWYPGDKRVLAWAERAHVPLRARRYGVELELSVLASHPLSRHKLTSYGPALWLAEQARRAGADGVVFVEPDGWLREAATANLFVVFGRRVLTPPSSRVLPGTVRAWCVVRLAQLGVEVAEEDIHRDQLAEATGAFLTASVSGLQPVRRLGPFRFPVPSWAEGLLATPDFPAPGYRRWSTKTRATPRTSKRRV